MNSLQLDKSFYITFTRDFTEDIQKNSKYAIWRCYHDEIW